MLIWMPFCLAQEKCFSQAGAIGFLSIGLFPDTEADFFMPQAAACPA